MQTLMSQLGSSRRLVAENTVFEFYPNRIRTLSIEYAVRRRFLDSIKHVFDAADEINNCGYDFKDWSSKILTCPRVPPRVWAYYHDLVQAAMSNDLREITQLTSSILTVDIASAPVSAVGQVVTVSTKDLGLDAERYVRIVDSDPERPLGLRSTCINEVRRIERLVYEGRALLEQADPALLDEIDTLGHQIVLASNLGGGFGGAATVFLWGAVILNPDRVPDRVTLVESLAHETAHALLFGMTLGVDLTTNDPSERYASPLRPDPRPIEGIVHATYVLARMNYALSKLKAAPGLHAAERALIETKMARNTASYTAGLGVVDAHARFTSDGEAIFAACREAMTGRL